MDTAARRQSFEPVCLTGDATSRRPRGGLSSRPPAPRTLAAQVATETGSGGAHCYGYNLGNVKGSASAPHQYLARTWEVVSPEKPADDFAKGGMNATTGAPLARIATDEECAKNGWGKQPGQAVVVFSPPHAATRFAAYKSLDEGVDAYVAKQQKIGAAHPELLDALNAGDAKTVAHTLKAAHYFTGVETDYVRNMTKQKAAIDAQLGPATS